MKFKLAQQASICALLTTALVVAAHSIPSNKTPEHNNAGPLIRRGAALQPLEGEEDETMSSLTLPDNEYNDDNDNHDDDDDEPQVTTEAVGEWDEIDNLWLRDWINDFFGNCRQSEQQEDNEFYVTEELRRFSNSESPYSYPLHEDNEEFSHVIIRAHVEAGVVVSDLTTVASKLLAFVEVPDQEEIERPSLLLRNVAWGGESGYMVQGRILQREQDGGGESRSAGGNAHPSSSKSYASFRIQIEAVPRSKQAGGIRRSSSMPQLASPQDSGVGRYVTLSREYACINLRALAAFDRHSKWTTQEFHSRELLRPRLRPSTGNQGDLVVSSPAG
ncbi:MAG: hypothetical protein M1831_007233 [Alyxoria varia]|nr:MAG: hypothetical protein M1831_007233 [Alyxoria varia]